MANVNINEFKPEDIDLKIEKRIPVTCKQFDNVILSFNVMDYSVPVDLTEYFVELKIQQPNGSKFTQSTGIVKTGNNVKITCANEVSNVYGKTKIELDFTNGTNQKKSSFVIVINVKESIGGESSSGSATPGNGVPVALAIPLAELETYVAEATVLNESFATNTATQATTQASLNASVISAKSVADSVADSLETANNLNTNVDVARALNDALVADIAIATPLKTDLTSINSIASATKTSLEAKIATANEKIAELESYDTSGLTAKVNTLQADVDAEEINIANMQSEIATARNGQSTLKAGIIDLIQETAPSFSVVSDTNFTNLKNDIETARLGEVSLTLGIRDAINNIVDPLKNQVNAISLTNADSTARVEIADARMGSSTLKIGIQKAIDDAVNYLESEISGSGLGGGTDEILTQEVIDARNGQITLKAGIAAAISQVKLQLEGEMGNILNADDFAILQGEIVAARYGSGNLSGRLAQMVENAEADNYIVTANVTEIQDDIKSVKDQSSISLKAGVQNMIDIAIEPFIVPSSAVTTDMFDTMNVNIMNVIISNEKNSGKHFAELADSMRVYSLVDTNTYMVITNGVYDQVEKCVKSNNIAIDSVAFCYD